jgi:YbgC/YbaW family acyl-CoA thioester hydrolase
VNLWIRLLFVLLRSLWRPRCGLLEESVLHLRVWPNDLDINGHVNNGRYLTLADLARVDFVLRSGLAAVALRHRAVPVVGDGMAKYRKELRLFDVFEIRTRLLGWDRKWSYLEHRFVRGGKTVAVVTVRGLFRTGRGTLAPQTVVDGSGCAGGPPALPDAVLAWGAVCDAATEAIRRSG